MVAQLAAKFPFAYVPRFYEPEYFADGRIAAINRTRPDVPETIEPSVISDLDAMPLPIKPIVPFVECVHDRIAIEIMRGCPVAVPLLPEHGDQAAAAGARGGNNHSGGDGFVPPHGAQRNFAVVAFDQRLSVLRAAGAADARKFLARWA